MKISSGVEQYVARKRAKGVAFEKAESYLSAFSRYVGDVHLAQVRTQQIGTYLDDSLLSAVTWRMKYYALLRFFDFWSARGEMPELLMPPPRAIVRQTFTPYVYSRAQLRALLKATRLAKNKIRHIDWQTMRTFILLLYGTGALVGEVLSILAEDVNLDAGLITIRSVSHCRYRQIPIGPDLSDVLRRYLSWRSRKNFQNSRLFVTEDDLPVAISRVTKNWQRLRQIAGVCRHDGGIYQPRMHDLRYTFAVHRITSWIRNGADLNRMLPALAAYMGQVGLGSTERYLHMTPERFRKELNKLSPIRGKGRWRDDKNLMQFLANL